MNSWLYHNTEPDLPISKLVQMRAGDAYPEVFTDMAACIRSG